MKNACKIAHRREIVLSGLSGFGGKGMAAACRLLSVPIMLSHWSIEAMGVWLLISAIPSWLSLSDIGIGSAVSNDITIAYAKGEHQKAADLFKTGLACSALIAGTFCFVALTICYTVDWETAIGIKEGNHKGALSVLILACCLAITKSQFSALFRISNNNHWNIALNNSVQAFDLAGIWVGFNINSSIECIAISVSTARLLHTIVYCASAMQCGGNRLPNQAKIVQNEIRRIVKNGASFCSYTLSYALLMDGATITLGHCCTPTTVAIFSTTRTLIRTGFQITEIIKQSIWNRVSILYGKQDHAGIIAITHKATLIASAMATASITILSIFGEQAYTFWTKSNAPFNQSVFLVISLGMLPNAAWNTNSTCLEATNNHQKFAVFFLVTALMSIPLCYFLSKSLGIIGAAYTTLLVECTLCFMAWHLKKRVFSPQS